MQTLDVVNACLATMGERPLVSLSSPHRFLEAAKQALNKSRRFQLSKGWWFNSETNTLSPQSDSGYIILGNDVLNVKPAAADAQYVVRGRKLYDRSIGTYVIGKALVGAEVIRDLEFEDIPESVAQYIAAEAVLQFQVDFDGDSDKKRRLQEDRDKARIEANADATRYSQANFIEQNLKLQRIKARMRRRVY